METYGCLVKPVMQFLGTVDTSAAFSASAGSDVTPSSFMVGTLRELSVALVKGKRQCIVRHVYGTVGGTAARAGAPVSTEDPE
jgi:hypothetical protein